MEQKEKQVLVSVIASLTIIVFYSLWVYSKYIESNPEVINDLRFWGRSFIVLIPVAIITQIVIHILFAIINKIVTGEDSSDKDDERDKLIELKSLRVSHWIFVVGFTLAMGAVALGMELWVMFVTLIFSGFLSDLISSSVKIWYYRKGV
jgi:uncharacterized membrane protein